MNPRENPNFYGYPSDIVVDLRTGKTTVNGPPLPRTSWFSAAWTLIVVVLFIPWEIWKAFKPERPWLGQIEPIVKEGELWRS